jgi:hypothetical protein
MAADHLSSRMTIAERAILFTAWLATSLFGAVFISSYWLTTENAETAMNASIAFDSHPLVETSCFEQGICGNLCRVMDAILREVEAENGRLSGLGRSTAADAAFGDREWGP